MFFRRGAAVLLLKVAQLSRSTDPPAVDARIQCRLLSSLHSHGMPTSAGKQTLGFLSFQLIVTVAQPGGKKCRLLQDELLVRVFCGDWISTVFPAFIALVVRIKVNTNWAACQQVILLTTRVDKSTWYLQCISFFFETTAQACSYH